MSDSERRIFPIESLLALASGRKDLDIKAAAGYITGRSMCCDMLAGCAAPFAAAWIARLYPRFSDLSWDEGRESWSAYVSRAAAVLGDKISVTPMEGQLQAACAAALDFITAKRDEAAALRREVAALSAQVEALKPLEGQLAAAVKRADKLDDQLKAQKKDMGALRRQTMEFQGKMAVDQEELLEVIKTAIKDNLKSITVAAAPAAGAAAATAAGAAPSEAAPAGGADEFGFGGGGADEFGFGGSGGEFGFGGSGGGDEFGFGGGSPAPAPEPEEPKDEFGFGSTSKDEFGF